MNKRRIQSSANMLEFTVSKYDPDLTSQHICITWHLVVTLSVGEMKLYSEHGKTLEHMHCYVTSNRLGLFYLTWKLVTAVLIDRVYISMQYRNFTFYRNHRIKFNLLIRTYWLILLWKHCINANIFLYHQSYFTINVFYIMFKHQVADSKSILKRFNIVCSFFSCSKFESNLFYGVDSSCKNHLLA